MPSAAIGKLEGHRRGRAWRRRSVRLVKVPIEPVDRPALQEYLYASHVADHMQAGCLHEVSIGIIEKAMALKVFVVSSHGIKDRLLKGFGLWCICDFSLGLYLSHQGCRRVVEYVRHCQLPGLRPG